MEALNALKLILLIFALPAQYYIANNWSNDITEQNKSLENLFTSISNFKENYLNGEAWKKWYINFIIEKPAVFKRSDRNNKYIKYDYSMATEVFAYRSHGNSLYHGQSSQIRKQRPSTVFFRVGQVVRHKKSGAYGVIAGWDENAQLNQENSHKDNENIGVKLMSGDIMIQPHYMILMDEKNRQFFKDKSYFCQEDIEIVHETKIDNNLLSSYFDTYDNGVYWSSKYLKKVYPDDQ